MEGIDWGDVIAALALLFSVYATRQTMKLGQKQNSLVDDQRRLNQLLVAREEKAVASEQVADVSANLIKLGNAKYKVKIFNKGNFPARNVEILFPEGDELFMKSEVAEKFPFELLEPHQSVELHALIHMGTGRKHLIALKWADGRSEANEKSVYLTY